MPLILLLLMAAVIGLATSASAVAALDESQWQEATDALLEADPTLAPPPQDPGVDSVHGAGHNGGATLALTASSDRLGGDPRGSGVAVSGSGGHTVVRFDVVCLVTAGNVASIGTVVVGGNFLPEGTESVVSIRDGGLPGGTGDGFSVIAADADTCPALLPIAAFVPPMETGNFHVQEALPSTP